MSQSAVYRIGKAKVVIGAKGCIDCGTENSSGWHASRVIVVIINGREFPVEIHRCDDCHKGKR